ncbi:MAG: hypothetical protein AAFX00_04300 [Pseudomonadota bacterium]
MRVLATAVLLACSYGSGSVALEWKAARTLERSSLEAVQHEAAALTIFAPDGIQIRLSPAEIEALGSHRLTTHTPWRDVPATFDGALLTDILEMAGLGTDAAIEVTAENDYTVVIEQRLLDSIPILVVTRVNGKPHTRRARGPIQFVMDMEDYEASDLAAERHWVWMAAEIRVAR